MAASLNGIDISNWQRGIDPTKIDGVEFCICKATEGKSYVSPDCDRVVQLCIKAELPWGFYHFGRKNDAKVEANFFIRSCRNYFGHGIPVLDWEADQDVAWVNAFVRHVYNETGIWPWIYANPWRFNRGGVEKNCGRWIAQYPSSKQTGFKSDIGSIPKTDGLVCCWQYTDKGKIDGWASTLDFDKFYGSAKQWKLYATGGQKVEVPSPMPPETVTLENDRFRVDITEK